MSKIIPNLWYSEKAQEAAAFYASLLPNSKVESVTELPVDTPSGPACCRFRRKVKRVPRLGAFDRA
jgi:predicted 3-demethylubiquinone-9 3-methyltransferase (glyoxalase superfamily)